MTESNFYIIKDTESEIYSSEDLEIYIEERCDYVDDNDEGIIFINFLHNEEGYIDKEKVYLTRE